MKNELQYPRLVRTDQDQTVSNTLESVTSFPTDEPKVIEQKKIKREYLVNKLNFINFQEGTVLVNFKHVKYDRILSVPSKPGPVLKDTLECDWISPEVREALENYQFKDLHVQDGHKLLCVTADVMQITSKGIDLRLLDSCLVYRARKHLRHSCSHVGIDIQLFQNSMVFSGKLIDFSAKAFRVELVAQPLQTFQWINLDSTVTAILSKGTMTLFAGECRIIRQTLSQKSRSYVLEPVLQNTHRFPSRQYRSSRYQLIPSPNLVFTHPLTKKLVRLTVFDLSGSGLSVVEDDNMPVMLPGLILPEMEVSFARGFTVKCRGQVIHKRSIDNPINDSNTICGLAFLDMNPEDHSKLLALLNQVKDKNSYISEIVDPDTLWNFFFETGFIYPKKYAFVQNNKEKIRAVYEKLYTQCPSIARHFVYQNNGRVLGHMSMVRFVGNSWMIHHHAANTSAYNQAGIMVLSQIHHYLNDTYKIYSAHLDHVFCYFRPDNKFPLRVFGGAVRYMKNVKACSVDSFAYFHYQKEFNNGLDMPESWQLVETGKDDLMELEIYHEHVSGGLMLNALGLQPDMLDNNEVANEYHRLGFKRDRHIYSLKKDGKLKAIAVVNISDVGLNLSDLTNCINFIVLDSEDLPREVLFLALSKMSTTYEQSELPVQIYPVSYADSHEIEYEKEYALWVLNLQYFDSYLKFTSRLLRRY